jgi:hypothetical protein
LAIAGAVLLLKARNPLSDVPTPAVEYTNKAVIDGEEYANSTVIIQTSSPTL